MQERVRLITTEDGSHSLFVPSLNETYHSSHGAWQESNHVFIKNGLKFCIENRSKDTIHLFEVGLGTGLNAILSVKAIQSLNLNLIYTALEPFPLEGSIISQLNYKNFLGNELLTRKFEQIHNCQWETPTQITENFTFVKHQVKLEDYQSKDSKFDLIFFDAFAPGKQPELWTCEVIRQISGMVDRKGILVTYCAKGQFKRDMKANNFSVETLEGPPGKKEMVRGIRK